MTVASSREIRLGSGPLTHLTPSTASLVGTNSSFLDHVFSTALSTCHRGRKTLHQDQTVISFARSVHSMISHLRHGRVGPVVLVYDDFECDDLCPQYVTREIVSINFGSVCDIMGPNHGGGRFVSMPLWPVLSVTMSDTCQLNSVTFRQSRTVCRFRFHQHAHVFYLNNRNPFNRMSTTIIVRRVIPTCRAPSACLRHVLCSVTLLNGTSTRAYIDKFQQPDVLRVNLDMTLADTWTVLRPDDYESTHQHFQLFRRADNHLTEVATLADFDVFANVYIGRAFPEHNAAAA